LTQTGEDEHAVTSGQEIFMAPDVKAVSVISISKFTAAWGVATLNERRLKGKCEQKRSNYSSKGLTKILSLSLSLLL
jgi:hypothetical protein